MLTDRAKALRKGIATVHQQEVIQPVDHLTDLAAVVGRETARTPRSFLAEHGQEPCIAHGCPLVSWRATSGPKRGSWSARVRTSACRSAVAGVQENTNGTTCSWTGGAAGRGFAVSASSASVLSGTGRVRAATEF